MKTRKLRHTKNLAAICGLLFLLSCSGGSSTSPEDGEVDPHPEPDGVLLAGAPTDLALAATRLLPPSAAAADELLDGLLTTRLIAILDPEATVGEVNTALESQSARIVAMQRQDVLMTLKIPPIASRAEAQSVANALQSSAGFLFVFPAPAFRPNHPLEDEDKAARDTPPDGYGNMDHLILSRMPAAWNAVRLARQNGNRVKVLVPDVYYSNSPSTEINAQSFVDDAGSPYSVAGTDDYAGNHGFHCSGIIGANFDGSGPTGSNPDPTLLLDIRSKHVTGLTSADFLRSIAQAFPASGKFVVSTSLGHPGDHPLTKQDFITLAFGALSWRIHVASQQDRYLHATAAGNEAYVPGPRSDARYGSGFSAAAMWDDPASMIPADSLSAAEWAGFNSAWNTMVGFNPQAASRLDNTLVVGSSDHSGTRSSFSNLNAHVRAVGEEVLAPCVIADPGQPADATLCDGSVARYSGTSMATPLIAGLAAYLWNLDPSLTVAQLKEKIQLAYDESRTPGIVDAHLAVLFLDDGIADAKVRRSILDVAGSSVEAGPNGRFDEVDVEAYLMWLEHYELQRSVSGFAYDYSRYDLNGDGITGGISSDGFDLDFNGGIVGSISVDVCGSSRSFEELVVCDREVLEYYAYSDLFQGDGERRDELLCPSGVVQIVGLPDRVLPQEVHSITVRAGVRSNGDVSWQEGIEIDVRVFNGSTTVASGTTDADGELAMDVSMRAEAGEQDFINDLHVEATAHFATGDVQTTSTVLRPNAIVLGSRSEDVEAEAYFFYDPSAAPGSEILFNVDVDSTTIPSGTESFDYTASLDESGSGAGMSAHGKIDVRSRATISGSVEAFSGVSTVATSTGFIQLSNPNLDVLTYSAYVRARTNSSTNFRVYGDAANFTVSGSVSGNPNGYYVWIFGPGGTHYECHGDDGPCAIGGTGVIAPGRYSFVTVLHKFSRRQWCQNGCGSPESGNVSANSNLSATLGVGHGG